MRAEVLSRLTAAASELGAMYEGRVSTDPSEPVCLEWMFRWPVDLTTLLAIAVENRVPFGVFPVGKAPDVSSVRVVMGDLISVRRYKQAGTGATLASAALIGGPDPDPRKP